MTLTFTITGADVVFLYVMGVIVAAIVANVRAELTR